MPVHSHRAPNDCPSGFQFYRCYNFNGCCKSNPCKGPPIAQCPDDESPGGQINALSSLTSTSPTTRSSSASTSIRASSYRTSTTFSPTLANSPSPTLPSGGVPTDPTSAAPNATISPAAPIQESNASKKLNGGLVGGVVGGIFSLSLILAVLIFLWRKSRKAQRSQHLSSPLPPDDDGMTGMGFADSKVDPQKSFIDTPNLFNKPLDNSKVYRSGTLTNRDATSQFTKSHQSVSSDSSTLMGSPDFRGSSVSSFNSPSLGTSDFGSSDLNQNLRSRTASSLATLNEHPHSSTESSHLIPRAEMLATVPSRESVTSELANTESRYRAELPGEPERQLINIPRELRVGITANTTEQVTPQFSVTTPEGIVLGSNLNLERTRPGIPENHVMSFMSYATGAALAGPLASVARNTQVHAIRHIKLNVYVSDSKSSLIWSAATDAIASQRFLSWEVGNIIFIAYMSLSVDQPKSRRWQMLLMERFRRPGIPKKSAIACTTVGFGDACNSHHSGIFRRARTRHPH
ncbi:uncharacterized protein PADG_00049 [Paracoccidioides brasiliensis Pb18]|uniref:Uncharacterized protein n=1 Tax=Paracoccidioides brasiliensis (strain Pb18) TaxID=502780 RepID=C1FZK9_PARBD|nr:uncharacterized protein PADG_00049 [Paracoccidioides brasiliensis Pb18]EEH43760.2 hypothetical protein PADG_00049 [Paracoccidioides brasiliensis Pb18]